MRLSINGVWWHALAPSVGMSSNARLRAAVGGTPTVQGLVGQTYTFDREDQKVVKPPLQGLVLPSGKSGIVQFTFHFT